ncbi:MAG: hypothetical protein BGN96_15465 [Bacteroidales bacterium 45-6]|nr:MAG: hypothetical protein BGN96_15465 [Bacteroidales bacterium 45-6]
MHYSFFINMQAVVPMRREPKETSEMVSQLLFGEFGCVLETSDSFVRIKNHYDAYVGWVDAKMVLGISKEEHDALLAGPAGRICQPMVEATNELDSTTLRLPGGALLPCYDAEAGTCSLGEKFRYKVSSQFVVETVAANPAAIAATARQFLNAPYLWGGKNVFGIDCSGLVQVAASVNGYLLPRDASQQVEVGRQIMLLGDTSPGDLAFFEKNGKITHVGILLSPATIIHASGHVKIEKIDDIGIISSASGEYTHHLAAIRTLFQSV